MLNPHDRRDLASLGLMVLVYGLAVAPVLHAAVGHAGGLGGARHEHAHAQGNAEHSHGARKGLADGSGARSSKSPRKADSQQESEGHRPGGHKHLTGSVEHLSAVAATWVAVHVPSVRWVSWVAEAARGPERVPGVSLRLTAMPQGP